MTQDELAKKICPAYAGMILILGLSIKEVSDLSRVCGDDPEE